MTQNQARDGRARVRGRVAQDYPGKVKLTVACPGKRARSTFVPARRGRWSRDVSAKRGCKITAAASGRKGWAASRAVARVS